MKNRPKTTPQTEQRIYQPSWQQYKHWFLNRPKTPLVALIVAVLLLNYRNIVFISIALVVVLPIIIFSIRYALLRTRTRLIVEPKQVTLQKRFAKPRIIQLSKGTRGFLGIYGTLPVVSLMIHDPKTNQVIRINGGTWSEADLVEIATACKLKMFPPDQPMTTQYVKEHYPMVLSSMELKPIRWALVAALIIMIFAGMFAFVIAA